MTRAERRPIRILHCPDVVGGHAPQLAAAERELGLESWSVALHDSPYGYRPDEVLFAPGDGALRREARRLALLRRALRDFDLIHFNFGQSMLHVPSGSWGRSPAAIGREAVARSVGGLDLPLLKSAGKGVVVTYQGDDARQGDWSRAHLAISIAAEVDATYYTTAGDDSRRRRIRHAARYADAIFALNPDLLQVLPPTAEFLPYASVDPRAWKPVAPGVSDTPVVVHAPTDRGAKGTRFVVAAIDALRADGLDVELVLAEGRSRAEARREYERADIVVDQLLAGWYGGVAVEAMALGKPVVAYIRSSDLGRVPAELVADLPIIEARPETLTAVLRRLLVDERSRLPALGAAGRAFVERWHDPTRIAERLAATYERIMRGR
jgi:hypothetical protein